MIRTGTEYQADIDIWSNATDYVPPPKRYTRKDKLVSRANHSTNKKRRYISVTLYSLESDPERWKVYATHFLRRLDAVVFPKGWTVILYHDARVTEQFIEAVKQRVPLETRLMTGHSTEKAPACWRFLVHDEPDTDVYYCMDMDSAFYKVDMDNIAILDDTGVDGVVGRPTWYLGDEAEVSKINAGGFGLRPSRFKFSMLSLLMRFMQDKNTTECSTYFFDERFLHYSLAPLIESNGNVVYTTRYNVGMCGAKARVVEKYRKLI